MRYLSISLPIVFGLSSYALAQEDSAPKFEPCGRTENVYRVDDSLLADKRFGKAGVAESNPTFSGGVEALQKYFDENLRLGPETSNAFGRIPIAFTVNCKGRVGEFRFIGKILPEAAEEIIKVAAKMSDWQPGKVGGKEVDTVVRLNFTIMQGKAKVGLK